MKARTLYAAVFLASGVTAAACGSKQPPPKEPPHVETVADAGTDAPEEPEPEPPRSLYERLGKDEGIAAFVETWIKNLSADSKLTKRMATLKGQKLEKFTKDLVDMICVEAGGPEAGAECTYEGRFMKELLGAKSKLKEDEWNAMLLDLRSALEEHKVGDAEQQDLAAALAKFRDDAVEPPKTK